jgi:hypothetical protein
MTLLAVNELYCNCNRLQDLTSALLVQQTWRSLCTKIENKVTKIPEFKPPALCNLGEYNDFNTMLHLWLVQNL